jgi:predicted metal-binding membrane protein
MRAAPCDVDRKMQRPDSKDGGLPYIARKWPLLAANWQLPQLLLISLGGWVALLTVPHRLILPGFCSAVVGSWSTHYLHGVMATLTINRPSDLILLWIAMLLATMPLLVSEQIALLCDRDSNLQRLFAMGLFAVSYGFIWLIAGAALIATAIAISMVTDALAIQALPSAIAIALAWQFTPSKKACLDRCCGQNQETNWPIAGNLECVRYGLMTAIWCAGAWGAMLLIPLTGDGMFIAAMAIVGMLMVYERLDAG